MKGAVGPTFQYCVRVLDYGMNTTFAGYNPTVNAAEIGPEYQSLQIGHCYSTTDGCAAYIAHYQGVEAHVQ